MTADANRALSAPQALSGKVPGFWPGPGPIVGATPLPGTSLQRDEIAAPVQTATAADIEHSRSIDLSSFLNRNLRGIHLNEMQGNPFQVDVNYRGYTASPLLGTPQGLFNFTGNAYHRQRLPPHDRRPHAQW